MPELPINAWRMVNKWAKSLFPSILDTSLHHEDPPPQRRPFAVTILIVVVLIFTSLNILRMITAIRDRDFLTSLPLAVPVIYYHNYRSRLGSDLELP